MFAMGLIAGIFGIISSLFAMFLGGVATAFGASSGETVTNLGWAALILSVVGIVGAAMAKSKPKLAGWLMIVAGIGGLISVSMYYILSTILFVVGGFMGVLSKKGVSNSQQA